MLTSPAVPYTFTRKEKGAWTAYLNKEMVPNEIKLPTNLTAMPAVHPVATTKKSFVEMHCKHLYWQWKAQERMGQSSISQCLEARPYRCIVLPTVEGVVFPFGDSIKATRWRRPDFPEPTCFAGKWRWAVHAGMSIQHRFTLSKCQICIRGITNIICCIW